MYLLPGNHDSPQMTREILADGARRQVLDDDHKVIEGYNLVSIEGGGVGDPVFPTVPEAQIDNFDALLGRAQDGPILVAAHFPFIRTGVPWIDDGARIQNGERLHELLVARRERVAGVFFGHIHQMVTSSCDGITYNCCQSTWFNFTGYPGMKNADADLETPGGFNLVMIRENRTFVRRYGLPPLRRLAGMPGMKVQSGDFCIADFAFDSGDVLPQLHLHYRTLGVPRRDETGGICNAVLILHGTTGSGAQFLRESFAGELFGPGQLLDAETHFIVMPDGIGHGKSSKPSDGLRQRFPRYGYRDMIRAQHRLVTEGLGLDHLHVVMGTSMGGMQTWLWGIHYPDFMDCLVPLASLPVEIAGRNRMMRKMIMDAIGQDSAWLGGDYDKQPPGLINAVHLLIMMTSCPLHWQSEAPTRAQADAFLEARIRAYADALDANDMLYAFAASEDYNPAPDLGRIKAPLLAINSADDQVNPPELGIMEAAMEHLPNGRFVLLPIDEHTRGHGSHTLANLWKRHVAAFKASAGL